jgi:hypothetical protein
VTEPTFPQVLADLDGHLREVVALRAEVSALRARLAEMAADRDIWRSRQEGRW